MHRIDQLMAEDFTAHVGKAFLPVGHELALVLVTLDRREDPGWEGASRKPFSLILRGPGTPVLPEGHYRLAIEDGPELPLYVIPILTAARDHQDYQIVFN